MRKSFRKSLVLILISVVSIAALDDEKNQTGSQVASVGRQLSSIESFLEDRAKQLANRQQDSSRQLSTDTGRADSPAARQLNYAPGPPGPPAQSRYGPAYAGTARPQQRVLAASAGQHYGKSPAYSSSSYPNTYQQHQHYGQHTGNSYYSTAGGATYTRPKRPDYAVRRKHQHRLKHARPEIDEVQYELRPEGREVLEMTEPEVKVYLANQADGKHSVPYKTIITFKVVKKTLKELDNRTHEEVHENEDEEEEHAQGDDSEADEGAHDVHEGATNNDPSRPEVNDGEGEESVAQKSLEERPHEEAHASEHLGERDEAGNSTSNAGGGEAQLLGEPQVKQVEQLKVRKVKKVKVKVTERKEKKLSDEIATEANTKGGNSTAKGEKMAVGIANNMPTSLKEPNSANLTNPSSSADFDRVVADVAQQKPVVESSQKQLEGKTDLKNLGATQKNLVEAKVKRSIEALPVPSSARRLRWRQEESKPLYGGSGDSFGDQLDREFARAATQPRGGRRSSSSSRVSYSERKTGGSRVDEQVEVIDKNTKMTGSSDDY